MSLENSLSVAAKYAICPSPNILFYTDIKNKNINERGPTMKKAAIIIGRCIHGINGGGPGIPVHVDLTSPSCGAPISMAGASNIPFHVP